MSQSSLAATTDGARVAATTTSTRRSVAHEAQPPPSTRPVPPPTRSRGDAALITALTLGLWATVVFLGRVWGIQLEGEGRRLILYTPPVLGGYRPYVPVSMLVPLVAGTALILVLPSFAHRFAWRATVLLGAATALGWWIALALVDGVGGLTDGLAWSSEMAQVEVMVSAHPRSWLSGFTAGVLNDGIQTRAHPPGLPLLLAVMNRWGMPGSGWAVGATLVVAASAVAAVLVTVRELAGEDVARRALPFLVLSPAAIWIATSFDAMFMGFAGWYVALFVLATARGRSRTVVADLLAVAAGVAAAVTIEMSYGLLLMGALVVAVAVHRRAWRPLVVSTVTALGATLLLVPFGFWWIGGLGATRQAYYALGLDRPYSYFLFADLSVLALVLGPAVAVALTRRVPRGVGVLVVGSVAAMAIADLSGLSTGEVERIWLPFAIWVTPAAAGLGHRPVATRAWLALQVASALVLTLCIRTFW
jgi:hypothetical protein